MENHKSLKDRILDLVKELGGVSFAELSSRIDGFNGERYMKSPDFENLIIWDGVSEKAIEALNELIKENKIICRSGPMLAYLADGAILKMPIAKKLKNYKKPHWIPMFLDPVTV